MIDLIDGFEGGLGAYAGDTGRFTTSTSNAQTGSYRLDCTADSGGYAIASTSGLNYYPEQGDTWRFWYYPASVDDEHWHYWAAQSTSLNETYYVYLNPYGGSFDIAKFSGGNETIIDSQSYSWTAGQWYEIEIEWGRDGETVATLYESGSAVAQVSGTDTTFTSGGVGWGAYPANASNDDGFDHARVTARIIDDFEVDLTAYSGDTGDFQLSTSTVHHGTYRLDSTSDPAAYIASMPGDGANYYPAAGDTWNFWYYWASNSDHARHHFGAQSTSDPPEGYYVRLGEASGFAVGYNTGSGLQDFDSTGYAYSNGTWYRVEIQWATDGSITATLYDGAGTQQAQVSGTDTTYSSGGIGWWNEPEVEGNDDGFDYAELTAGGSGGGGDSTTQAIYDENGLTVVPKVNLQDGNGVQDVTAYYYDGSTLHEL